MELDEILMKLSPGNQTWYEFSVEGLGLICFSVIKKNRLDPESRTYFVFKYTQAKSKSRGSTLYI
jgi:hypothetical protein